MMQDLHVKYRPSTFKGVYGHTEQIKSIASVVERNSCHAFLLTGPSGVGKTTVARIIAKSLGCTPSNLMEVDAATYTGIDAMRDVAETLHYTGFGENPVRVMIIDEAHALSRQAWQSLLKTVEEPPPNSYWIFCTTDEGKLPGTIKTRCLAYEFSPLKVDDIVDLLVSVVEGEGIEANEDLILMAAEEAMGSPREALTIFAQIAGCKDAKEAAKTISSAASSAEVIDLCRALVAGNLTWVKAMKILNSVNETSAESIRLVILAYLSRVAMGATTEQRAGIALEMIDAFSEVYYPAEKFAPLLISIGRVVLPNANGDID